MESRVNPERQPDGVQPPPAPPPAAPDGDDTPVRPQAAPDAEALRGTRFEFGGRRPYSFSPPRVDPNKAGGRPLPGIGTVALGRVSRVAPFGAFVDFLGFRGMIHISQLLPGYRVERVEDVVQLNDEVQVRVIGVDPERRHINLALVTKLAPGATPPAASGATAVAASTSAPTADSVSAAPAPGAPAGLDVAAAVVEDSTRTQTPLPAPPDVSRDDADTPGGRSDVERGTRAAEEIKRVAAEEGVTVDPPRPAPRPVEAAPPPVPVRPAMHAAPRPAAPAQVQANAQPPVSRSAPPAARVPPAAKPAPAAKAPPAEVAQHGSRSVRRELADPRHPMARLLATAGEASVRPRMDKDRVAPEELMAAEAPPAPPRPVAPEPPRPVHVFGPDPEPENDQPATLEALAARFGAKRDAPPGKGQPKPADRSRQEREKQAQILAKLRQDASKYAK